MISSTRAPLIRSSALLAVGMACVSLAMSTSALAATVVHFQPESLPALKEQLAHHEVHALAFHPASTQGHVHVSLNDGRHMTVVYATPEQTTLVAIARADGVPVAVATAKAKPAAKPAHHKLRYIAGGILVVVIIVVAVVLLIDRRRKMGEGDEDRAAEGPAVSSPPGEQT
jgi:hypothetical protein